MEINLLFEDGLEGCLDGGWLRGIAEQTLVAHGSRPDVELGLVIASQARVQGLNKTYLGRDEPTDVLAFAMLPETGASSFASPPDGIEHLGEVLICYPQAVKQAQERRHPVKREVAILVVHGVLHLLGYDHGEPEPTRRMAAREAAILDHIEGRLP